MKKTLLLLTTVILLFGCKVPLYEEWFVEVENNSNHDVIFCVHLKKMNDLEYRPSTGWPETLEDYMNVEILKKSKGEYCRASNLIKFSGQDSLTVFIFSPDTLKKYSYDEIRRVNNYLKRYDYIRVNGREVVMYP